MRKAKSGPAEIQRLRSVLLRDGITTYPLAMQAIAEFRHEVFSILERVAKARVKAISRIVSNAETVRYSHEVDEFLDGADTLLSVYTKGSSWFEIDVVWRGVDRPPAPVRISAGIYLNKRSTFESVARALQDRFGDKFITDDDEWGCYLEKSIEQRQVAHLESELDKISDAWIKMLHTANIGKVIRSKQ